MDKQLTSFFAQRNLGKVLDSDDKKSPYKKEMQYTTYVCVDINRENTPDIVADAHDLFMIKKGGTVICLETSFS